MERRSPRPGSQHGAAGIDDDGRRLRVAAVDAQQEPVHAALRRSRSGRRARCAEASVVDALGHVELPDEGRAQRPDAVVARSGPGGLRGERLVLAEHLHEATDVARQRLCRRDLDAVARAAPEHLDDESSGKPGSAPPAFGMFTDDLVLVVEDRVHHVDRELELVDAAA